MAGKYNTRHNRAQSKYPERLKKRGMSSASVRMEGLEALRKRQGAYNGLNASERILLMEGY